LSLAVNSQPSGVLIKPSRIEEIIMRSSNADADWIQS
jgi:hypothetical protein